MTKFIPFLLCPSCDIARDSGAPLVFTEYFLDDCRDNLDVVEGVVEVDVVKDVERNAFSSREVQRSPLAMWGRAARRLSRGRVMVDNGHVAVVTKKISC